MAAPVIPIIKKVAAKIGSAVASNKKGRNTILWIIGIVTFLLLMPIIALLAIFNSGLDISQGKVEDILTDFQTVMERTMSDIDYEMTMIGFSELRIEEAQSLFMFALIDKTNEENFVDRYVDCFEFGQTDKELIDNVNAEFGTNIIADQFTDVVQEIRDKYKEMEDTA